MAPIVCRVSAAIAPISATAPPAGSRLRATSGAATPVPRGARVVTAPLPSIVPTVTLKGFVATVKLRPVRATGGFVADAGGLPIEGGTIRRGRLLRVSGDLVAREELRDLEAAGLRTYIDLRGADEDCTRLERWARRARLEYVRVPI